MGPGRGRKQSRPPKGELRIVRAGSTEGDVIRPRDFPHFSQRESTPTSHSVLKRHCKRLEGAEFQLTEEVPVLSKLYEVGEETFSVGSMARTRLILIFVTWRTATIFAILKLSLETFEEIADHSFDLLVRPLMAVTNLNVKTLQKSIHVDRLGKHVWTERIF